MKTMVTGGAGFLAGHLIERLLSEGHDVVTVELPDRVAPWLEGTGVEVVRGDIRDPEILMQACRGVETVFHPAALAAPFGPRKLFWSINVAGTDNVVAACKKRGVKRLVHVSSASAVCDGSDHIMADESLPYPRRFLCHYSETKAESERRVVDANGPDLETVAMRPHAVWGPRDRTLFPRIIVRAGQGKLLQVGDGSNEFSVLYVDNAVDALILAASAKEAPGRIYSIADEKPVILWKFIRTMLEGLNMPGPRGAIPYRAAFALGAALETAYTIFRIRGEPTITRYTAVKFSKNHSYSIDRAKAELGYRPKVSVDEGLEKVYEWVREKGLPEGI